MEHHRISLFDRNGGNLLKKKLSKRKRSRITQQQLKIYAAEEVKIATDKYSSDRRVMRRCKPGIFYRGRLDSAEVAVAMVPAVVPAKVEQFVDELIFLSLPHRNLVKLLGCCLETSYPLLVYELHGEGEVTVSDKIRDRKQFSCEKRAKAAAAAARGLAYLQSQIPAAAAGAFCHGNVCGGNILLDDSFDAKLFYAAASSSIDGDRDAGFDDVRGFGVVLAELLSCRTAESLQEDDFNLATFLSGIEEGWSDEEGGVVREVASMAAKCLNVRSEERPSMRELEAQLSALCF